MTVTFAPFFVYTVVEYYCACDWVVLVLFCPFLLKIFYDKKYIYFFAQKFA